MGDVQVHEYKVAMTCEGCSAQIQKVLGKHKDLGITNVAISVPEQRVAVTTTQPADKILDVIKKTGKEASYLSSK